MGDNMALNLYREVSTGTYLLYQESGGSSEVLPIITTHDGVLGEVVELRIFVRNDDITEYYENIQVTPVCNSLPDETIGTANGHGVKLFAGNTQPTEAQWEAIDYGAAIDLDDLGSSGLGDTYSYLPFWYRAEVPAGTLANNKENIVLRLSYVANAI